MKSLITNKWGGQIVFLKKGEDYPGTIGITGKQGYYIVHDDPLSISYLGIIKPTHEECLKQLYI